MVRRLLLFALVAVAVGGCGASSSDPPATSTSSTLPTIGCFNMGAGIEPSVQELEVMIDSTRDGAESPIDAISSFLQDTAGPWDDLQGNWEIQSETSENDSEILAGSPEIGVARFRVIEIENGWFVEAVASCSY